MTEISLRRIYKTEVSPKACVSFVQATCASSPSKRSEYQRHVMMRYREHLNPRSEPSRLDSEYPYKAVWNDEASANALELLKNTNRKRQASSFM
jgi:hypothetical protein